MATSTGLEVLNAGAVMDSLEEKYLEAEDKLNMEARPGPQFLTSTGFLRKCPLGLGEISAGLGLCRFPFDWNDGEGSIQCFKSV